MASRTPRSRLLRPAIMGSADGVTIVLGLLVSLAGQPHALFRAAVGASLAELVGMTAGEWLSDGEGGFGVALANGAAAFAACLLPGVPYLLITGPVALAASLALVAGAAAVIAVLRPEKGPLAWLQTFGILAAAAGLCYAASLL
jgi:VIT1/CCC1 family predicted Fe2+/Mn2+ transporter